MFASPEKDDVMCGQLFFVIKQFLISTFLEAHFVSVKQNDPNCFGICFALMSCVEKKLQKRMKAESELIARVINKHTSTSDESLLTNESASSIEETLETCDTLQKRLAKSDQVPEKGRAKRAKLSTVIDLLDSSFGGDEEPELLRAKLTVLQYKLRDALKKRNK